MRRASHLEDFGSKETPHDVSTIGRVMRHPTSVFRTLDAGRAQRGSRLGRSQICSTDLTQFVLNS
jgi:hypothetical protein